MHSEPLVLWQLQGVVLPSSLQTLTFGQDFNQALAGGSQDAGVGAKGPQEPPLRRNLAKGPCY